MEARITCPESYWPQDKVSWHVQIMEHQSDGMIRDAVFTNCTINTPVGSFGY